VAPEAIYLDGGVAVAGFAKLSFAQHAVAAFTGVTIDTSFQAGRLAAYALASSTIPLVLQHVRVISAYFFQRRDTFARVGDVKFRLGRAVSDSRYREHTDYNGEQCFEIHS